ncbi:uncharacterized protein TRUGW13939_02235 [Talaromyces rugulosus]|uniref:Aminoglycoside phosphotransferase domain-containing protein n=1 Tax=Talaromyces rugulosus TaxID=121627 RepID=A0A7H8QPR9_TALRU|nr:uncharacterized protein TRUGW13939_02235 [Talaromyces rugulosus]QKX55143.1 hypothetical protein TRUGW13939_02235 [Talaromyces rugulosus]
MGDKEEAKVDLKYSMAGFTLPDPETIYASPFHGWVIYRENEAKAMILIEKNAPNVPVLKVLAYYRYGPHYKKVSGDPYFDTFIFREYVEGDRLKKSWGKYDEKTKRRVADQLKTHLRDLRQIPGGSYIGSIDHGPLKI